jgi:hypothetical protein
VLSYQAADALQRGKLAVTLQPFEARPWPVSLVHAGQGPLPLKVRAFLDFAAPRLRAMLSDWRAGEVKQQQGDGVARP